MNPRPTRHFNDVAIRAALERLDERRRTAEEAAQQRLKEGSDPGEVTVRLTRGFATMLSGIVAQALEAVQ